MATRFEVHGKSGKRYLGWLFPLTMRFDDISCVYVVMAYDIENNDFVTVYVGETEAFGTRLSSHEKKSCWEKESATHVFVFRTDKNTSEERRAIKSDILTNPQYLLPCNR